MRWAVCVIAAAFAASTASGAGAQPDQQAAPKPARWLVLPVAAGATTGEAATEVEALHRATELLRQELAMRGQRVWPADRATERFEVLGSAPAPSVSQSDIDRWVERSRAAVRYLARADYKAARRELKAAQRLANRAAEELNREAARAQQVLDTCLYMVRAYVETQNSAAARRQARECRQMVPRVEPTAFRHTPEVRELLAEVDREIASEAPGRLAIESSPSDCSVRINGVEFGRTPLADVELPVGTYRVQVECEEGRRGRIHRVAIKSGENQLQFDASFERAVRTRPVLHLQYDSSDELAQRIDHATRVGSVLGGARQLVSSPAGPGQVRLDLSAEGYEPASVWLAAPGGVPSREDSRRAVEALLDGRSVDFTGAHPLARASWRAEREPSAAAAPSSAALVDSGAANRGGAPRPRPQRIAGWSLFGLGLASLGASVGLHVWRGELGDRFIESPASLDAAQQWHDARIGVWTTAAFSGAASSAAMPLLLPDYPRTPWWGWTLGALGLGLTGYAVYEGVTMTGCPEPYIANQTAVRDCVERGQEAGRVALALAGAAPLLTVPLVYLFRPLRAEPSVSATRAGALFRVRKSF